MRGRQMRVHCEQSVATVWCHWISYHVTSKVNCCGSLLKTSFLSTGVLISPYLGLLPDVFCLMVRIFRLILVLLYTEYPRKNGQNFRRVFLMLNYTDITQNTYIQSWTVTEIMAIENCGLLGCPRTVSRPWRHTHPLRMPGNENPLANIGMQWPWQDNEQLRPA